MVKILSTEEFLDGKTDNLPVFRKFLINNKRKYDPVVSIKMEEIQVLSNLIQEYDPKTIFETGTNIGVSTAVLSLFSSPETKIFTADIPDTGQQNFVKIGEWGKVFKDTPIESKITMVGKSTFDLDIKDYPDIDFWFFDSDHTVKTIEQEISLALSQKHRKVMVFHDATDLPVAWHTDVFKYLSSVGYDFTLVRTTTGTAFLEVI
jgi:predicted O-methyltransferase YrrM